MNNTPTEAQEQEAFVWYLELKGIKFTAIPNSTYTKSWKQKMKNKQQGLRPGLPDLLLIHKDKLIFIEMKRVKGGGGIRTPKRVDKGLKRHFSRRRSTCMLWF